MGIELIDDAKTYDLTHPSGAVFTLKYWTNGMQAKVDLECLINKSGQYSFDVSKDREMKIEFSVIAWKDVLLGGEEVPCTPENKKRLPVGVMLWLQKEIEERAGLRMTEDQKKN